MKRPVFHILFSILALALAVLAGYQIASRGSADRHAVRRPIRGPVVAREKRTIYLYFEDRSGQNLKAEPAVIPWTDTPEKTLLEIVDALFRGPTGDLVSPIPDGTKLRSAFLIDNGTTAVLDLSREVRDNHPGGSHAERHTIFALVNAIALNIPDVRNVKLLIDGKEADTLAGHIDIRFPLKANMLIVR